MLAFPSTYTVGITSLGYQVVWATLARRADVDVRRLFTDRGDPPHRDPELFGLSLSWELDGPVLLNLLEAQRIPIWAEQRGDNDPLVFGGGPVLTANPEPLAPFLDAVLLGDGELLLPAFVDAVLASRGTPRAERLHALAQVEGVYVPSLYAPRYDGEGQLLAGSFLDYLMPSAADTPRIRVVHEQSASPSNPFGVKGLGEGGAIGPPVAIANAVCDALAPYAV